MLCEPRPVIYPTYLAPMNGIIRKLATLGLLSIAASGLGGLLPTGALALTEEQILDKLVGVPVFLIVNGEGQSLTASVSTDSNVQVPIVFIDSAEAQAFIEQAEESEAEFAGDARIAVLPLSDVYAEASEQLEDGGNLVYIPSSESISTVSQLLDREIDGVPLFAAIDLDNEQYLLTQNNQLPMFFSLRDLQSQVATLIEADPELEESIGVEVISFELILANMSSEDPELNEFLELIQFIPSSQTLRAIQSRSPADSEE